MDGKDIYRTAKILIDKHGADAPGEAAERAARFLLNGDVEGSAVWQRVMRAVYELRNTTIGTMH
jgi:hypothetical protein